MNMQTAINSLKMPKSLVRRTNPRDQIDQFWAATFDSRPKNVSLGVYETDADKWFVIVTHGFAGWTTDPGAAFYILNNCFVYTLAELDEMAAGATKH